MPPVKRVKTKKSMKTKAEEKTPEEIVVSGQLSKKLKKQQKKNIKTERGIVLIKHLPHGFFEEQLKKYFEQFGKVTRLRLVRSRRTGGSKGFAFVEFEYPEVAQLAAETMDNYLMFQKLVKASYIPPSKQLYNYFKTTVRNVKNKAGKTIFVSNKTAAIKRQAQIHNDWSEEKTENRNRANLEKIKKLNEKYKDMGLDFTTICLGYDESTVEKAEEPHPTKKEKKEVKTTDPIGLEDLLGDTIQEDSNDEDWQEGSEDSEDEFAEPLYLDDNSEKSDEEIEKDDDSDNVEVLIKKSKKPVIAKENANREHKLVKRRPNSGGVQKVSQKLIKKPTPLLPKPAKNTLLLSLAKQTAKPLSKIKQSQAMKKKVANRKNKS